MLLDYNDLLTHLENMVKIRAANYVSLDCDIEALIYTVYEDIQQTVLIDIYKQEHIIVEDETDIVLRNNNAPVMGNGYDEASATARYTDVLDIVDKNDISILKELHNSDTDTWTWNNYTSCDTVPCCTVHTVGDPIYFIRKKILEVKYLTPDIYNRILNAMLEGIMYYIQTALPSAIDDKVGNWSYQRFFNAKKALVNLQPQHNIQHTKEYRWL